MFPAHRATTMSSIGLRVASEYLHKVLDATWLVIAIAVLLLQGHRCGSIGWDLEGEGKRVVAELLDESLLQFGEWRLLHLLVRRVDTLGGQVELLLEVQAHHLVLFAAVTKAAHDLAKDLATIAQVLIVQHDYSVCKGWVA